MGAVVDETAGTAAVAFEQGTISATATTGNIARVTALNGGNALTNFATAAGNTSAADITALNGLVTSLATDLATAQAAQAAAVTATGAPAASGTGSAAETATAAANLAEAQAILAEISGTAAVAAVAQKSTTSTYSRLQFNINGSTVADNGMEFGGKMRIQTTGATSPAAGPQVYLKTGDVTVYGGNIPGPLDTMPNVYGYTVGFSGGTFQGLVTSGDKLGYSSTGNGSGAMQVDYSNGNVTVKAAHQPGTDINQAMISYSMNGLTVAAGGQFSKKQAEDLSVVSLGYTFGDVSFALASGELDKTRKTTLSASGSIGNGVSLQGYIVEKEKEKNNGWGLGISYDLGGGAKFAAGYETKHDKTNRAEAGFHFTF